MTTPATQGEREERLRAVGISGLQAGEDVNETFQRRAFAWVRAAFGKKAAMNLPERRRRVAEEMAELLQACGLKEGDLHSIVQWVYRRPPGERGRGLGGVMVALAALAEATGLNMADAAEAELARISDPDVRATIRQKQQTKPRRFRPPKREPLPPPELCIVKGDDEARQLYTSHHKPQDTGSRLLGRTRRR